MEEESGNVVFILGDTLPTYCDVALSLVQVCTRRQGEKAQKTLNAYYGALMKEWISAFGEGHTLSRKAVMSRLEKVRDSYLNDVILSALERLQRNPTNRFRIFADKTSYGVRKSSMPVVTPMHVCLILVPTCTAE